MCGVPVHSAEAYLARLIKGGNRVAIAEQTESPAEARKARGSKALVDRAIVRLVTPGTLTEETLLESAAANWLAAIARAGDDWAIAAADISTGRFELVACGPGELAAELARLSPAETDRRHDGAGRAHVSRQGRVRQPCRRARAEGPLRAGDARRPRLTLARRACRRRRAARLSRRDARKRPASCSTRRAGSPAPSHMAIDAATRDSLELTRSVGGSVRRKPARRDRPLRQPAPARRLLCEDIRAPLTDKPRDRGAAGARRMAARGRDPRASGCARR